MAILVAFLIEHIFWLTALMLAYFRSPIKVSPASYSRNNVFFWRRALHAQFTQVRVGSAIKLVAVHSLPYFSRYSRTYFAGLKVFDLLLVTGSLYFEVDTDNSALGLLVLSRIWRFARIGVESSKATSKSRVTTMPYDFHRAINRMVNEGEIDKLGLELSGVTVPRELERADVTLVERLGSGAFGEVWKGLLNDSRARGAPAYLVAIKRVKNAVPPDDEAHHDAATEELLREAVLMFQVGNHRNLCSAIGVVTVGIPMMLVITFCEHGSLLSALRRAVAADRAEVKHGRRPGPSASKSNLAGALSPSTTNFEQLSSQKPNRDKSSSVDLFGDTLSRLYDKVDP